ncbi:MAG: hypothetical protein GF401_03875 [Chitinivibrionales bacterium]|nr:hypothetical protein [Chitinivibrionales bacterium]
MKNFFRWRLRKFATVLSRIMPVRQAQGKPQRILCIISGGMGDRLMALPALRNIKNTWPAASVTVLWTHGSLDIVDNEFDATMANSSQKPFKSIGIASRPWDLVYVNIIGIYTVFTEFLVALSRAPVRIGPTVPTPPYTKNVYTTTYNINSPAHATITNMLWSKTPPERPQFYPVAIPRVAKVKKRIGIHPGVKKGYEIKQWPVENFATLARLLHNEGAEILILFGPDESGGVRSAFKDLPVSIHTPTTERELFETIASLNLFIGNDSGPGHVAASVGTNVIVLFGPTDPQKVAPVFKKGEIIRIECACAPCFETPEKCTNTYACMKGIGIDRVVASAKKMLG